VIISDESSVDIQSASGSRGRLVPKKSIKRRETAERVAKLRELLGYDTQVSFAAFLGVGYERYNHVERGKPLSYRLATIIARKCPMVTRGWLLEGDPTGIDPKWFRRLSEPLKRSAQDE
jgi:signal recognition particle subunit SEC65